MRMQLVGVAAAMLAGGSMGWAAVAAPVAAQGGRPDEAAESKDRGHADQAERDGKKGAEGTPGRGRGAQPESEKEADEPSAPGTAGAGAEQAEKRGAGGDKAADEPKKKVYRTARDKVREAMREAKKAGHSPEATKKAMEKVREAMEKARKHMRKARKGMKGHGPGALDTPGRGKGPGHAKRMRAWMRIRRHMHHPSPTPGDIPHPVRAEMRRHAKRVAKLDRIQTLAKREDDDKVATRAEKLLETENQRHDRRLKKLFDKADRAGSDRGAEAAEGETPGKKKGHDKAPKKGRDKGRTKQAAGNAEGQRGSSDEAARGKGRDE